MKVERDLWVRSFRGEVKWKIGEVESWNAELTEKKKDNRNESEDILVKRQRETEGIKRGGYGFVVLQR